MGSPAPQAWLDVVLRVLRPARPALERCAREREEHLGRRSAATQARARAIADCEARIESARAEVFAAKDGVVPLRMTDLEREWRMLSRPDPDGALMDLWARVTPKSWLDRKRWRESAAASQLDAVVALASDVEGVEAAERAIAELRTALAPWGSPFGGRVRWRMSTGRDADFDGVPALLEPALRAAAHALSARDGAPVVFDRARRLEREVYEAAHARFPERDALSRALAHAAYVDAVWRTGPFAPRPSPAAALRELWCTGYVLEDVDRDGVTLAIPPL